MNDVRTPYHHALSRTTPRRACAVGVNVAVEVVRQRSDPRIRGRTGT